jgi:hypothetical protein
MKTDEPVLCVVENVFFQYDPKNKQVGDLFLSQDRFCFIPYASFESDVNAVGVVTFILLTFAQFNVTTDNEKRLPAVTKANEERAKLWGTSLPDRMKLASNSLSIFRNEISGFDVRRNKVSLRTDKRSLVFKVKKLSKHKDLLLSWHLGSLGHPDACAVTSKYMAPAKVFAALLADGQSQDLYDELNAASRDTEYMAHLWTSFEHLAKVKRISTVIAIVALDSPFSSAFAKVQRDAIASANKKIAVGIIALIVSAFFIVYTLGERELSLVESICWIFVPGLLGVGIILTAKGITAIRKCG